MHVEISVALNFVISYLYNKLPRRRVDLFGEELEIGLKAKFLGHWYPENPSKGSGFRCVKGNGDAIDAVIIAAAIKAGLDIQEVKNYLPEDLTLWIDPSEVSYKIGEKSPVKILYSDRKDEDGNDNADREVQAANRTFNPDAQTFTPESQAYPSEILGFSPETFCSDTSQSFQPIDSLSSSLSAMSLSPSSPVPPGTWSTATSPSSNLFSSALPTTTAVPSTFLGSRPVNTNRQQFTAATFAQTKFGSTKLKSHAKRPNRLSPTEFGNYFRQQQRSMSGPQRPRSLSPRDPRIEFLIDQQQRMLYQQQQQQQVSPSLPFSPNFGQPQQQTSPTGIFPDFLHQPSSNVSPTQPFSHLSNQSHFSSLISPQRNNPALQDILHSNPNIGALPSSNPGAVTRPNSLSYFGRPSGFPNLTSPSNSKSPMSHQRAFIKANMLSPEDHKSFVDGFNIAPVNYANNLQHLLMAN